MKTNKACLKILDEKMTKKKIRKMSRKIMER